jgi:hypothetical protein
VTLILQNVAVTFTVFADKSFQPEKSNTADIDTHYSKTSYASRDLNMDREGT